MSTPGPDSTDDDVVLLPASTEVGAVALTVVDLARATAFYARVIGLEVLDRDADTVRLGVDGRPLVILCRGAEDAEADRGTAGLFHLALLFPDRASLAAAVHRLLDVDWPLTGASDHLVSEAVYLADPEGNGIELYVDRPASRWPRHPDGRPRMDTLPLDLGGLLATAPGGAALGGGVPPATRMGHVHLRVADVAEARAFYVDALGLSPTEEGYPGALFAAAGGYHHHVGANVWHGAGVPAPAHGAPGLRFATLVLPSWEVRADVTHRLEQRGHDIRAEIDDDPVFHDPSGLAWRLAVA